LALLVHDQNRLDRIHRSHVMPFIIASGDYRLVATSMVAFDNPALHQNRMAVGVTNRLATASNGLGKQTTRTSVAVINMFGFAHRKNAEAPERGLVIPGLLAVPRMQVPILVLGRIRLLSLCAEAAFGLRRSSLPCGNAASFSCRLACCRRRLGFRRRIRIRGRLRVDRKSGSHRQQARCKNGFQFHGNFSKG
jgi:hypothetical protein